MLFDVSLPAFAGLICLSICQTTNVAASRVTASKYARRQALSTDDAMPTLQGGYIVEFESVANGNTKSLYSNLSSISIDAAPRLTFSNKIFNGASFTLSPEHDHSESVDTIKAMSIVKNVWPIRTYELNMEPIQALPAFEVSEMLRKRDTGTQYIPHIMGGVDKLHAEGLTGKGLTIGIVDTGVDYNHPLLGGGFGPGFKVKGGRDLVGDNYVGESSTPVPDDDPLDCFGHGTHVAGIIAAMRDPVLDFSGVAPDATILAYKVFGCSGSSPGDIVMQGLLAAFEDGADLINMSVGSAGGWPEDITAQVKDRISAAGVPVVIAASNSGSTGPFYANSDCSASSICIGAVDLIADPELYADMTATYLIGGDSFSFNYTGGRDDDSTGFNFFDFGGMSGVLYPLSLDTSVVADACSPLPDTTPQLASYIVLVRQGGCSYDTKATNLAAYGARAMLIYNDLEDRKYIEEIVISKNTNIMAAVVSAEQGAAFIAAAKTGVNVILLFSPMSEGTLKLYNVENTLSAGTIASYSSWGPNFELGIKPEISAPGTQIFSTYLTTGRDKADDVPPAASGFGIHSGTSMAAPYIAGVVALMKQANSGLTPEAIRATLATTGKAVLYNNLIFHDDHATTFDYLSPVAQQGGGLVDAYAAVHYKTLVSVANIALNDTFYFQSKAPFTITNTGSTPVTYKLSNVGAATIFTFNEGDKHVNDFPFQMNKTYATARIEPSSITIAPGQTGNVVVHVTRPVGLDEARAPIYSGFIAINGTNGENLAVPYMGISTRMKDIPVLDYATLWSSELREGPWYPNSTFHFIKDAHPNDRTPIIRWQLFMGSANVRIDVVPTIEGGVGRIIGQKALGGIRPWSQPEQARYLPPIPFTWAPRSYEFFTTWAGQLENGDWIPEGQYHILIRALRIGGDPTYDHDYDRVETVPFYVVYDDE